MGGQRLVRLQGDPLALQEVLLSARTRETAGPCAHLNTVSTKPCRQTLADTQIHAREESRREEKCLFLGWAGHVRTLDCNTCRYSENSKRSITRWKVIFRKGWMWTSPDETDHVALQMSFSFALLCRCTLLSYLKRRRATCAAP